MYRRSLVILCFLLLGLSAGGCTKCGPFWEGWQQHACHSDTPH